MARNKVYNSIVDAIKCGDLLEPFSTDDFRQVCTGFADRTYTNFLSKHRVGNPSKTSELFEDVIIDGKRKYKVVRPFKYQWI